MTQPSGGYDEARLQVSDHSSSPRGQIHIHSCPWNRGGTLLHTHTGSLHKDGISANATPHFYSFCPSPALPAFAASAVFSVFLFYFSSFKNLLSRAPRSLPGCPFPSQAQCCCHQSCSVPSSSRHPESCRNRIVTFTLPS